MRSALSWVPVLALAAAVALLPAGRSARAEEKPLVEKVRKSIDGGVNYLLGRQRPDGGWELDAIGPKYHGGQSALALLALLNAGVKPGDAKVQKGLAFLRKLDTD